MSSVQEIAFALDTLHRLGYLAQKKEGIDEEVLSAVRSFQQSRGLTITGELSSATLTALEEAHWRLGDRILALQAQGFMRGDDVAQLQTKLLEMGFNVGKVDGIYGAQTAEAVSEFQKSVGVKIDSLCGPETVLALLRLSRVVSGGAPNTLRDNVQRSVRGPSLANKVVVIDPANLSTSSSLDETLLDLAERFEGRLIALGVSTFLTRNKKSQPTTQERVNLANSVNADLVISLSMDSYPNESAHGIATYYYGNEQHGIHSVVGERFAQLVQREICARTDLLNCWTHSKSWDLLRLTKAPTVRLDLGYASNPGDVRRILDPKFREVVVEALMVALQRLYLSTENDARTGTLRLSDLRGSISR